MTINLPVPTLKIAVVGDIHDQWEELDNLALQALAVDLVLFVGDLGNESLSVVRLIADLPLPKAVILGNHDAWYTASDWGRKQAPYDHAKEDRVQTQLDWLGETEVGYGKLDFPQFQLSVVGSRPFSWGGPEWKSKRFLRDRYGVRNFQESADKIVSQVQASHYQNLIFLGQNGPYGLGHQAEAICGRDWPPFGSDHGDPDLAEAIAASHNLGKKIPFVTFGHMHHRLRHTQTRLRTRVVRDDHGTVYLNAASVPRILNHNGDRLCNFSIVTFSHDQVQQIDLIWVNQHFDVKSEELLYTPHATMMTG